MANYQFQEWRNADSEGAWAYWVELDDNGQPMSCGMRAYVPTEMQLGVGNVPPASAEPWSSGGC